MVAALEALVAAPTLLEAVLEVRVTGIVDQTAARALLWATVVVLVRTATHTVEDVLLPLGATRNGQPTKNR